MLSRNVLHIFEIPPSWRVNSVLQKLLQALRAGRWVDRDKTIVLSVSCVNAKEMARLNWRYRKKHGPTDVLSFEQPSKSDAPPEILFLGDLVLCSDVVRSQAKIQRHSVRSEVAVLLAHGLLHLLGYDHERSPSAARKMAEAEAKLLRLARVKGSCQSPGLITRSQVKARKR